jgi:beta-lactamase family protein
MAGRARAARVRMALFFLGSVLAPQAPQAQNGPQADAIDPAGLAAFLDPVVQEALAKNAVPGAAVAVVQAGRVLLLRGYGVAGPERKTPVDPERTVFRVGSVSKPARWGSWGYCAIGTCSGSGREFRRVVKIFEARSAHESGSRGRSSLAGSRGEPLAGVQGRSP